MNDMMQKGEEVIRIRKEEKNKVIDSLKNKNSRY